MWLDNLEKWFGWMGGLAGLITLGVIFYGVWRGMHHPLRRSTGLSMRMLRSPAFFVIASLIYFGICYLIWRPIPLSLSVTSRVLMLLIGVLLFNIGLALVLWGRLTLGKWYNVSTSLDAPLYDDHRLIISGPFAYVRNPMYLGILLVGLGGILLYQTWTMVFITLNFPGLVVRARREEQALAAKFGEQWQAYCQRTPAWIPRFRSK